MLQDVADFRVLAPLDLLVLEFARRLFIGRSSPALPLAYVCDGGEWNAVQTTYVRETLTT